MALAAGLVRPGAIPRTKRPTVLVANPAAFLTAARFGVPRLAFAWQFPLPVPNSALLQDVALRDDRAYHDYLRDWIANDYRSRGAQVVTEIPLVSVAGARAQADIIARPPGSSYAIVVEIKTGSDPGATQGQEAVYPLVPVGYHVRAMSTRVTAVGLEPYVPLPPLGLMVLSNRGPGQPIVPEFFAPPAL
ncbi:hypothetical protein [Inquilinus limosus]|uniref:hypothetical protein n=1 Tax=Inquilinus limosus TaxID=171674 RepID=UPI000478ECCA|nr:hypothetical protein [Inquilinus limosus]